MKKILVILTFVLTSRNYSGAQVSPYQAGEKISYDIHYGIITGGIATLELNKTTLDGQEVLHSYLLAKTTGLADVLYRVKDIYESYINPSTELPVKAIRDISEGRYKRYNVVTYDHDTRKDSAILNSDLTGIHITQKGIHDILSCFYYFRKHYLASEYPFRKGEMITIMTWFTDELYPIKLVYVGTEEVRTRAGRINCYKFNPVTEVGRLFKTEEDVSFWFSADKNYLPVKIRFDIFVGAFTVDMTEYEGLAYPLNFKTRND
jgi:hypothetical protein